ncbi:MAG: ATP-binding cassette domain-containing protein [Lachnospiraceae bacterium]|nr:ATP-binding cassette domain-containing protein [Lachnospiraceae bacterium]
MNAPNAPAKKALPAQARTALALLFWLLVWLALSIRIRNPILMTSPANAVRALGTIVLRADFWQSVLTSAGRILEGFFLGAAAASLLAALSLRFRFLETLLRPLLNLFKATPVAAFSILILLWIGPSGLAVIIAFLLVSPLFFENVLAGLSSADAGLLEMARLHRVPFAGQIRYIYLPALRPGLTAAFRSGFAMSFKAGIAAEVIGLPARSIGENLYMAKIHLATEELFAWVIVILLVSWAMEKLLLFALSLVPGMRPGAAALPESLLTAADAPLPAADAGVSFLEDAAPAAQPRAVEMTHLRKSFGDNTVLPDLTHTFAPGSRTVLRGRSGSGKTTLLRLAAGLESPDAGTVSGADQRFSMVFQEDRLLPEETAARNLALVCPGRSAGDLERLVKKLIPEADLAAPVSSYSGGMKRRLALLRALVSPSQVVLLDEPFTGLDDDSRRLAARAVRELLSGRTLIAVSHDGEDAGLLDAQEMDLITASEASAQTV